MPVGKIIIRPKHPYVYIYKTNRNTVAESREGEIAVADDDVYVFKQAIEYIFSKTRNRPFKMGKIIVDIGDYIIDKDLILQKNSSRIIIEGISALDNEYDPSGSHIILKNNARIIDDQTNWGYLTFKNITISVTGEYTKTPITLTKTLLFMENVLLRATHIADTGGSHLIVAGSGGPPGLPVTWRNVIVLDGRKAGSRQYSSLFYIWYEGFMWKGGSIIVALPDLIGWIGFFHVAGNIYAVFEKIDMFVSAINGNKYEDFFSMYSTPLYFRYVEFIDDSHIARAHISNFTDTETPVYIDHCRYCEAGKIMIPKTYGPIKLIFGSTYKRTGVATLSGDGTTTDFVIAKHNLKPDVTDKTRVMVNCSPISLDAINASPVICYLSDEDGDGIYESIRAKFASPPAVGTNNVVLAYEIKYVK